MEKKSIPSLQQFLNFTLNYLEIFNELDDLSYCVKNFHDSYNHILPYLIDSYKSSTLPFPLCYYYKKTNTLKTIGVDFQATFMRWWKNNNWKIENYILWKWEPIQAKNQHSLLKEIP